MRRRNSLRAVGPTSWLLLSKGWTLSVKTQLTDHDKKLLNEMVVLCNWFLDRELDLKSLVTRLTGLLDAGDFPEKELRDRWYSLWLPMEIRNATGEHNWSADAAREAQILRSYINDLLKTET
jgi:hypothetical protein